MRTILLIISFIFFTNIPLAYSQSYYEQNALPQAKATHSINGSRLPKLTNAVHDSVHSLIDYYLLDSLLYGPSNFRGTQGQLLNSAYSYPTDTTNSYKARSSFFMNYFCINAISVAFDTIPHFSEDTVSQSQIDTLFVPIIQVNHSGINDTLDIQITTVDANGYPITNSYQIDTLVVADSTNSYNIGAGNDYTINTIKWNLNNYSLSGGRFAVNVTYHDSTKKDSCWFIYGYGYFHKTCPFEGTDSTFAEITHFSKVNASPKPFFANSFAYFNQYTGLGGYLPAQDGNNEFFPCTAADTDLFHPGIDGANYLQDIDIAAHVYYYSYAGIPNLQSPGISVSQNYPNPYDNTTVINYNLIKQADVSWRVVDLAGREIISQSYGTISPGQHSITLHANTFSAGIYFYSITSSGYTITKKMVIY